MDAIVAHRCALCSEDLFDDRDGMPTPEDVEDITRDHHAVCPKRPIEVGDYVRWERRNREMWAEGEVILVWEDRKSIRINVTNRGGSIRGGGIGPNTFDGPHWKSVTIRRIPRPAEAQVTVPVFPAGADRSQPCPTCSRSWGEHYGIACSMFDQGRPCESCGGALRDHAKLAGCRGPAQWIATSGTKVHTLEPPPAPALVDGIDREVCLARWMENRLAVEGGAAPPNVLTRMQVDVGRAMWLQRFGAARSAELRELVAADREAERCRVTYCEVDPCE